MTTITGYTQAEAQRALAEASFTDFLDWVKVEQPSVGAIPFEKWPHLEAIARILPVQKRLNWGKSRQVGATWELAAYELWCGSYKPADASLLMSKTGEDAKKFLDKCLFIYENLPLHLQVPLESNSERIAFPQTRGIIRAIPSGPGAGRSWNASRVIMDEADFQEYFEENFASVSPALEGGGQFILASTAHPYKTSSRWQGLFSMGTLVDLDAPFTPIPGWASIFVPWHARPGRSATFREEKKLEEGLTDFEVQKEYPNSVEEMLAPSRSLMFFDWDALVVIRDNHIQPPLEERLGAVKIWRKPYVGGRYVAFGDNAWGEKGSYSCTTIEDWRTGEVVAEIHARMTLDELARLNVNLCTEYNRAFIGVEANGEGITVVNKMIEMGYGDRMYHRGDDWRKETKQRGWWTDNTTRPVMLGEHEEAVRMHRYVEHCADSLEEHIHFIRNEKGRPQHGDGWYDDHVMSRAGAWQMRHFARWSTSSATGRPVTVPGLF